MPNIILITLTLIVTFGHNIQLKATSVDATTNPGFTAEEICQNPISINVKYCELLDLQKEYGQEVVNPERLFNAAELLTLSKHQNATEWLKILNDTVTQLTADIQTVLDMEDIQEKNDRATKIDVSENVTPLLENTSMQERVNGMLSLPGQLVSDISKAAFANLVMRPYAAYRSQKNKVDIEYAQTRIFSIIELVESGEFLNYSPDQERQDRRQHRLENQNYMW